jgi:isopenicillin-N N-acyltransferase-like protein
MPRIRIRGVGHALGADYGEQARPLIARSLQGYAAVFRTNGWAWDEARRFAIEREGWLQTAAPDRMAELRGLAAGAEQDFVDILALNLRSEILQAIGGTSVPEECTSFGLSPAATADGHVMVGQNWDYPVTSAGTVVALEVETPDRPFFVTFVEAGLLAKTGMSEIGLGLVTNTLATTDGPAVDGLPYHFVLRSILESSSVSAAISAITGTRRASAANYLIGHSDGVVFDVEAAPGDHRHARVLDPERGVLVHANHFVEEPRDARDGALGTWTDSWVRRQHLQATLAPRAGSVSASTVSASLRDHANFPYSVCRHPDPEVPEEERSQTHFSVIYDLSDRRILLAEGPPCESVYEQFDVDWPTRI